jgi:uncharacterized protein (DUF58 family)
VIIFGIGFAALNTGNNLLYLVLSLMLSFLTLSGVLSESALRGIQVRRKLPREIYAGGRNPVLLEIHNTQRRVPAFAIVVEDHLYGADDGAPQLITRDILPAAAGSETRRSSAKNSAGRRKTRKRDGTERAGRCFALRVAPGTVETRRYHLEPAHRGRLAFKGFRVSTRFPFGLFLKSLDLASPELTLVYPEILASRALQSATRASTSGEAAALEFGRGGSVGGLREFEEGDSMRRVHWRSSLRRGALLVVMTEDDQNADIEVRLRGTPRQERADACERFEQRVSRAASEVIHHLEEGISVALRTDASYFPPAAGPRQRGRLLSFLALVESDGSPGAEATR